MSFDAPSKISSVVRDLLIQATPAESFVFISDLAQRSANTITLKLKLSRYSHIPVVLKAASTGFKTFVKGLGASESPKGRAV